MNIIRKLFVVLLVLAMMLTVMPLIALPTVADAEGSTVGDPGSSADSPATTEDELKAAIGNTDIETIYISGNIDLLTEALPTITRDLTIIGTGQSTTNITVYGEFRHFVSSANLTLKDMTLTGRAPDFGGGVYTLGTATLNNCTFTGNAATNDGGGVRADTATLTNCTFTGNTADFGGGVWVDGTATLNNCTFTRNEATYGGGGVYAVTAKLIDCTFIGNAAINEGGGVWANKATLNGCTFIGNTAIYGGGVWAGTAYLTNCTFTGNEAEHGGGVLVLVAATLNNCTFTGNTAIYENGGGVWAQNTPTIRGSIVAGNTAGDVDDVFVNSAPWQDSDNNYNIIGGDVADIFGTDSPALASNGGLTQTILIRAGGPAHDKIPAATLSDWGVTHDQRGVERPQGTLGDIGAVELSYIPTPPHNDILDPSPEHFAIWRGVGTISARMNVDHAGFVRLSLGGYPVGAENYTVTAGSTVITLHESYLKSLENGDYAFRAEFHDGFVYLNLTVDVPADAPADARLSHNVPPTGVTRSVVFPMLGLSIGVLFIVGAEVYRRRLK